MKKLFLSLVASALTVCGMFGIAANSPAAYATVICPDGSSKDKLELCYTNVEGGLASKDLNTTLNTIINVVIGIVGFVAVVMMILGGISFITSQGDSAKVTKARNTILYGVVGLVVALLAFAIVNFVLSNVFNGTSVWL